MRMIAKAFAVLGYVPLKMAGFIIDLFGKASSILAGPFLVFVIGCCIYSAVTAHWRNLVILVVVGGVCTAFYISLGLILGLIDIAGSRIKEFLRS